MEEYQYGVGGNMNISNLKFSNKEQEIYLNRLIGKIFKILPLFENDNRMPTTYLIDLICELHSANNLFDGILIEILIKLNSINNQDIQHEIVRKTILECTRMVVEILNLRKGG